MISWRVVKEARRRLKKEQGTVFKDWGGRVPIVLVYPNSYHLGMSNLGFHTIYGLLNSYAEVVCERAFFEEPSLPLLSVESQRPLPDFAVLAFSVSYEMDYLNMVRVLRANHIPLLAIDRDERHPLIIAGGPCITANPEPISPFCDCLAIGEGEAILPPMLPIFVEGIPAPREKLLEALALVPGLYLPRCQGEKVVVRQWAKELDDFATTSVILTPETELRNMHLMEVTRGCRWGCRFCLAGFAFRPFRYHSLDKLVAQAEEGLRRTKHLGLVGAAVSDHPQIEELVTCLRQMGAELSTSSLRIRPLTRIVLRELARGKAQTISLAPEAGSERLRQLIKKGIAEEDIFSALEMVAEEGLKQVKLYFMLGLPTETDEDILEMVRLVLACQKIVEKKRSATQLILNITPFVPKAGTPFQWLPMADLNTLNHRLALLQGNLRGKGIALKSESIAWCQIQALLARGDSTIAKVIASVEQNSLSAWQRAISDCQVDVDFYAHREWDIDDRLPWSVVDSGTSCDHLRLELERACSRPPRQAASIESSDRSI